MTIYARSAQACCDKHACCSEQQRRHSTTLRLRGTTQLAHGGVNTRKLINVLITAPLLHSRCLSYRESRRLNYKNKGQFRQDELKKKREEQQVEIRKQKREESIAKRRNLQVPQSSGGADSDEDEAIASQLDSQVSFAVHAVGLRWLSVRNRNIRLTFETPVLANWNTKLSFSKPLSFLSSIHLHCLDNSFKSSCPKWLLASFQTQLTLSWNARPSSGSCYQRNVIHPLRKSSNVVSSTDLLISSEVHTL